MKTLKLTLALAALLASGCCSSDAAGRLGRQAKIYRAHAADRKLHTQARAVASDAADAFEAEAWALGGPKPSPEVLERIGGGK